MSWKCQANGSFIHVYQEGPTSNECQKVRTEDRGGKEVVFWAGLGKDHAHKGSEGSKPGVPMRAAKSPPIFTQLQTTMQNVLCVRKGFAHFRQLKRLLWSLWSTTVWFFTCLKLPKNIRNFSKQSNFFQTMCNPERHFQESTLCRLDHRHHVDAVPAV